MVAARPALGPLNGLNPFSLTVQRQRQGAHEHNPHLRGGGLSLEADPGQAFGAPWEEASTPMPAAAAIAPPPPPRAGPGSPPAFELHRGRLCFGGGSGRRKLERRQSAAPAPGAGPSKRRLMMSPTGNGEPAAAALLFFFALLLGGPRRFWRGA
jgi:hypothetical protein